MEIIIDSNDAGCRIDKIIRRELSAVPLSHIYKLFRKGGIRVNGKKVKERFRPEADDILTIPFSPAERTPPHQEGRADFYRELTRSPFFTNNFKIIFEDDYFIACNKPSSLVVHAGSGHTEKNTLIDLARAYQLQKGIKSEGPYLIHRLDKDTSGVILLAKDKQVLRHIHGLLRDREDVIEKYYTLICHNTPTPLRGTIDVNLAKTYKPNNGTKMQVTKDGMGSKSTYRVLWQRNGLSHVKVRLFTGRTHQIRVHMNHLSCPILGDMRYGERGQDDVVFARAHAMKRLYLHAHVFTFPHPISGETIRITAEEPSCFREVLK